MWFLLHDGEPWGYQYLREWRSEGFVHSSGAQMIYSADGTRVGLIVPDEGRSSTMRRADGNWDAGVRTNCRAASELPFLRPSLRFQ